MIKGIRLELVSEDVETKEQYEILEILDVDYIQGQTLDKVHDESRGLFCIRL